VVGRKLPHGELEERVLDVLWEQGTPMTPAAVRDGLASGRSGRPLAYTTVMTILVRLWEKDLLDRERAGRGYAYRPRVSREERIAARMGELLATTGERSMALARFVESLTPAQREELRRAMGTAGTAGTGTEATGTETTG
jgi:predicted transcriptional regulator